MNKQKKLTQRRRNPRQLFVHLKGIKMQNEPSPKPTTNASSGHSLAYASALSDRLQVVAEVIGALYMMTSEVEDDCYRLPFRRIIELAETELAFAQGLVETSASKLRVVAEEMRAGARKPTNPTAANCEVGPIDPLSMAIENYRRGEAAFNAIDEGDWPAMGGERAVVAQTYGSSLAILEGWQDAATTRASALEALRLAHSENSAYEYSAASRAMVAAALAFFEQEAS